MKYNDQLAEQEAFIAERSRTNMTTDFSQSLHPAVVAQRRSTPPKQGTRNDQIAAEHLAKLKRMLGPVPK